MALYVYGVVSASAPVPGTEGIGGAQLELITGAHPHTEACVEELAEVHQFVYQHLRDEMLWSSSMPCRLPPDDAIPIGQYGR